MFKKESQRNSHSKQPGLLVLREEKRREEKRRQYLKDPVRKIFYGKLLQKYLIGLGFFSCSQ